MYEIGGGTLSLSTEVAGNVISGTLAVLPLKDEASWMGKMRDIGVDEDVIQFFGSAAGLASNIVSIIGWAQAAIKVLEMLGVLKTKPSLEDMIRQILAKLELVQDMVAETQESGVKLAIDTSRGFIESSRDACEYRWRTLNDDAKRALYDRDERNELRNEMLEHAELADGHLRGLLSTSRWRFICQSKHYRGGWVFYSGTGGEEYELKNPPWWGHPRFVRRQQLADDGYTWVDAVYPAGYKGRFDYRAALPHAVHGAMSVIAMLQMTEPEFRSTGLMRGALLAYAEAVGKLMLEMRRTLVRTKHLPYDFQHIAPSDVVSVPLLGTAVLKSPFFYWQVGALDLCAHTDSYFNDLAAAQLPAWPAPPDSYKLGTLEFNWTPPAYELRWVPPPPGSTWVGHWEMANAEECAAAAEKQSEADYMVLLQSSGYFQLAQLHAMLEHLATDPDQSETVTGSTRPVRRKMGSRQIEVKGYDGLFCDPFSATGTLEEYRCQTTVSLTTQEPDRLSKVPTRCLLVALGAPAGMVGDSVLSEFELNPSAGPIPITLPAVWSFDFLVEKVLVGEALWAPSMKQLQHIRTRDLTLPPMKSLQRWAELGPDFHTLANELPSGDARNKTFGPITFDVEFSLIESDTRRGAWARVTSLPGTRNVDHVYIATEETLYSGKKLRTYFEVEMYTQLTYVSSFFFAQERKCLEKTARMVDEIDRRFSESAPKLPPHVPITVEVLQNRAAQVRAVAPELVATLSHREKAPGSLNDKEA